MGSARRSTTRHGDFVWTCEQCGRSFANRNQTHSCRPLRDLDEHFAGTDPAVRETFDLIVAHVERFGPVNSLPEKTRVAIQARMSFAAFVPRKHRLDGHLVLAERHDSPRFTRIEVFSPRNVVHTFRLEEPGEVDAEFRDWLRLAYDVGMQRHLGR